MEYWDQRTMKLLRYKESLETRCSKLKISREHKVKYNQDLVNNSNQK